MILRIDVVELGKQDRVMLLLPWSPFPLTSPSLFDRHFYFILALVSRLCNSFHCVRQSHHCNVHLHLLSSHLQLTILDTASSRSIEISKLFNNMYLPRWPKRKNRKPPDKLGFSVSHSVHQRVCISNYSSRLQKLPLRTTSKADVNGQIRPPRH